MSDVKTTDQPEEHRYEGRVDGRLAGFAAYELDGDRIVFTHTEVDDAYEGQGVGSAIVRSALEDVRARGDLRVVPRCPFVSSWIEQHPDFASLVEGAAAGAPED
jgi:predicted GNAT family acetyltransferase